MTTTDDQVRTGEMYETPDDMRIEVHRVAHDGAWAHIRVIQPNGASWTKRQPLVDGRFSFKATRRKAAR